MATVDLWQRIWGHPDVFNSEDPQDQKIALHRFWGMLSEWGRGKETQANVLAMFNIASGDQMQQGAALKDLFVAAPNKTQFLRVCKDWSYIAETNLNAPAKYHDVSQVLARLQEEVLDQGGTLPQ